MIELLCAIAIIGILAALLLPALSRTRARAVQAQCVNQLQQTGLGFHGFAHDHGSLFPMQVPESAGGSLEYARSAYQARGRFDVSYHHFQALAGDLSTPKILACPADTRLAAPGFVALRNENLSYFVAVNAEYSRPSSLLAGDRNVTNNWTTPAPLQRLDASHYLRWTEELHRYKGNLLFADGHVGERNSPGLLVGGNPPIPPADIALPWAGTARLATAPGSSSSGGAGLAPGPAGSFPQKPARPTGPSAASAPPQTNSNAISIVLPVRGEPAGFMLPTAAGLATPGPLPGVTNAKVPAKPPLPQPLATNLAPESAPIEAVASPPETVLPRRLWKFGLLLWLLLALLVTVGLLRHYSVLKSEGRRRS